MQKLGTAKYLAVSQKIKVIISMGNIRYNELLKCIFFIFVTNIIFAMFLFPWVTDDDLNNIPEQPLNRFISLFYYGITTFTTTGYGDIYPKSNRMKIIISFYMIIVFSITVSVLFKF